MMNHSSRVVVFAFSALSLAAASEAWKQKEFPDWTEEDAKQVMTDSPWAKTVTPTLVKTPSQNSQPQPGATVAEEELA